MFKKYVVLFASLGLVFQLACTSKDSKGDEDMAMDGAAVADSAEVEKVEGEQSLDIAADDSAASLSSSDALPEDALGEAPAKQEAPPAQAGADTAAPPMDIAGSSEPPPPVDTLPPDTLGDTSAPTEAPLATVETPPTESMPAPMDTSSSSSSLAGDSPKKESKPAPAYRKVETTPMKEGGKILNTVYLARKGDTWAGVSKMIYGSAKSSELKKMNPAIKARQLKIGDKVYYNSPHRPDDETKVLTYYEDSGIAPEVYIAKSGDTAKTVAKEIFGTDQGWKELYATNEFESKGKLDEGTQIRYWRNAAPPPATVADHKTELGAGSGAGTADANSFPPPAEDHAAGNFPPPAPPAMDQSANAGAPPPPAADMAAPPPPPPDMANNEMAPPPPPPPVEAAPPPPPPPPADVAHANKPPEAKGAEGSGNPLEDDQMTTLAGGAIVAVGIALFIIIRRRRKKELEQAIQDTQVG